MPVTRQCTVFHFCTFFKIFHIQLEENRKNVSFYTVYVCGLGWGELWLITV